MASDPVDNPFRNSAWPQMPQAPFRVGPLPKSDPEPAPRPEPAPPVTITPAFVRPVDMGPLGGLAGGGAVPAGPRPRPVEPDAPRRVESQVISEAPAPEPQGVQLAPIVVEAARRAEPLWVPSAQVDAPMAAGP